MIPSPLELDTDTIHRLMARRRRSLIPATQLFSNTSGDRDIRVVERREEINGQGPAIHLVVILLSVQHRYREEGGDATLIWQL